MTERNRWTDCIVRYLVPLTLLMATTLEARGECWRVENSDILRVVREGQEQLLRLEVAEAQVLLAYTTEQIPCLADVPSPQLLAQLWLHLGVARRLQGDVPGARAAFEQALTIHPLLPWNRIFGSVGRDAFDQSRKQLSSSGLFTLRVPRVLGDYVPYLDGAEVKAGRRVKLRHGRHLLQVVSRGQVVWARWVEGPEDLDAKRAVKR